MNDETIDLASGRFLNKSAIREHALECSKQFRAGMFTRVGSDFMDEVRADVECIIRELRNKAANNMVHPPLEIPEERSFVTGAISDKLDGVMNQLIGRIIQNKVQRQPSCGVTLSRTR